MLDTLLASSESEAEVRDGKAEVGEAESASEKREGVVLELAEVEDIVQAVTGKESRTLH
jgi:hypothetical protein